MYYNNTSSGVPGVVDSLILALGLGSSGHYISPEGTPRPNDTNPLSRFTCDCDDLQVCRHVTTPPRTGMFHLLLILLFMMFNNIIL